MPRNVLPPPQKDWDQLHGALGRAVSHWGDVEKSLSRVFAACLDPRSGYPAVHAFWEPRAFETKLKMTNRAVLVVLIGSADRQVLRAHWLALRKLAEGAGVVRNRLAHGSVECTLRPGEAAYDLRFVPFANYARYADILSDHLEHKDERKAFPGSKALYAPDLEAASKQFSELSRQLHEFSRVASEAVRSEDRF